MESAMLAVRRTSFPKKNTGKQKQSWHRFPKHAVRNLWIIHQSPVWMRQDAIKCGAQGESCISCSLSDWNVTLFMHQRSQRGARTCWQSHSQLELLPARRWLSLLLCGFRNFALAGCFGDEVDRRGQSVRWELVAVPQLIVTLREGACRGGDDLWVQILHQFLPILVTSSSIHCQNTRRCMRHCGNMWLSRLTDHHCLSGNKALGSQKTGNIQPGQIFIRVFLPCHGSVMHKSIHSGHAAALPLLCN